MNHPELSPSQPKKSGSPLKWILLGCGGLIILVVAFFGISGYLVYKSFNQDPAAAEAAAQEILTFEKPAGYKGAFSMSMMGVKTAMLAAGEGKDQGGGVIMLSTFPAGAQSQEQFDKQFKEGMERRGHSQAASEKLPAETFKVRGKDTTAQVAVVRHQNSAARNLQYTLALDGGSGKLVMLVLMGPEATTDHAWVQKFLDTVK